jgi:hypothetical protein
MGAEVIRHATWVGPAIDDHVTLDACPPELQQFLKLCNGFILFSGGLHVRGTCITPEWHSLSRVWHGDDALYGLYGSVEPTDVPFAQDCMGDQFLLREGRVIRLSAEQDTLHDLNLGLAEFFGECILNPESFLSFNFQRPLQPGEVFFAYPPFVIKSEKPSSLGPVPTIQALQVHASIAKQLRELPDGAEIRIKIDD